MKKSLNVKMKHFGSLKYTIKWLKRQAKNGEKISATYT